MEKVENFINGKEVNKKLITYLGIRMQSLIKEAKIYSEIAGLEEEVVEVGDGVFIRKEKYAEYGLLSELNSYISFEKNPAEETFADGKIETQHQKRMEENQNEENRCTGAVPGDGARSDDRLSEGHGR